MKLFITAFVSIAFFGMLVAFANELILSKT